MLLTATSLTLDAPPIATAGRTSLASASVLGGGMVVVGAGLQGYANSAFGALLLALLFLPVGCLVVGVASGSQRAEVRAFMLAYGVCVLAGGMAQCFALRSFHQTQTFSDAIYFLGQVSPQPPFVEMVDMPGDTALALVLWQAVYRLTWWLDLQFGVYGAVMFNALIIGLSASLTVATARNVVGDDPWRMRRVGTVFALCGLFVLFGAILIRDSLVVLLHAIWLWAAVRWLARPDFWTAVNAAVVTAATHFAMWWLRPEAVVLFGVLAALALVAWYLSRKLNSLRLLVLIVALCSLPIAGVYLSQYAAQFQEALNEGSEKYAVLTMYESTANSLGVRLLQGQPMPIRLLVGTVVMLVNPIPLWANFRVDLEEYYWIRGYNGIYQVCMVPLGVAGLLAVYRLLVTRGRAAIPAAFVAVYLLIGLAAVVASSGEQRHLGPFLPALMILAAIPDTHDAQVRAGIRVIAGVWIALVVGVHLAWAVMKGLL